MSIKAKLGKCWGIIVFPIAYLLARVIVHNLYSLIVSFISVSRVDPRRTIHPTDIMFILTVLLEEVEAMYRQIYNHGLVTTLTAFTMLVIVFSVAYRFKSINLKWMFSERVKTGEGLLIALCVTLGIAVGILQSGAVIGTMGQGVTGSFLDMFDGSVGNAAFWLVAVMIFIPLTQEVVFRGIVLYRTLRVFSPLTAIVVHAILFAAVTLDPLHGIYTFVLGLVLGYVYWKTGSIWASFMVNAAHAIALFLGYNLLINAAGALVVTMVAASVAAGGVMVFFEKACSKL